MKPNGSKPKRGTPCAGCGSSLSPAHAQPAYVATFDVLAPGFVCAACARSGVLIVMPQPAEHARAVLRPFADHLRRLAKPYEMNGDARAVGLLQAADVLESGRAVSVAPTARVRSSEEDWGLVPGRLARQVADLPPPKSKKPRGAAAAEDDEPLGGCELALLAVLARQPGTIGRTSLGLRAGYSVTSGGYSTALGTLRGRHLITGGAGLSITAEGRAALERSKAVNLPEDLVTYWVEKVGGAAGTILQVATAAYPDELSRVELAQRAGYSPTSGGYAESLGKLRSLKLLDGCRASHALMQSTTI